MKSNCQVHEDTVKKLQEELDSASSIASEKQEEMLVLSAEVTSLREQICCYSENEMRKQQELSVLEAQHSVLKEKFACLQNQLAEVKEFELKRELCHQTMLREKAQELERTAREHHTKISALTSERDAQISSLKAEMKNQQLRSERLRAQLELKVEKQNGSILALKNMARRWEQQNKDLLEKLKIMFTQLQHYSGKNKEAREMNKSLVNCLQASRREVEDLQMERDKVKSLEARVGLHRILLSFWGFSLVSCATVCFRWTSLKGVCKSGGRWLMTLKMWDAEKRSRTPGMTAWTLSWTICLMLMHMICLVWEWRINQSILLTTGCVSQNYRRETKPVCLTWRAATRWSPG